MTERKRSPHYTYIDDLAFPLAQSIGAQVEYYQYAKVKEATLSITFVGRRPRHLEIDRVLRDSLALAVAHDARFDIYAHAWFLASATTHPDQCVPLSPYGKSFHLFYDRKKEVLGLRRVPRQKGPVPDPVVPDEDDTAELEAVTQDAGEAVDNATEDLAGEVEQLVWYGFKSPAEIDVLIDSDADDDPRFDVKRVKTVVAETLATKRAAEAQWEATTDCDRLDRAFARLHEQGVCALHCTGDTQDDGFEALSDALDDDLEERYHGYCFYYSQDIDHALEEDGLLLAFGHIDMSEVKDEEHVAVGRLVCEALRQEGLEVEWSGSKKRRIALPQFVWRRRTPA